MFRARSGYASGYDLAALCCEIFKRFYILVIYFKTGVRAETADFTAVIYAFFSGATGSSSLGTGGLSHFLSSPLLSDAAISVSGASSSLLSSAASTVSGSSF